jgi:hypothetical protein
MKRYLLVLSVLVLSAGESWALPPCPGDANAYFNNCQGTRTWSNGDKYVGEYWDNNAHGQGTFTQSNGQINEGIWENGKFLYARKNDSTIIATVLGKEITTKDKDRLRDIILGTLLVQFAKDNTVEPTDGEIDNFILKNEEILQQLLLELESQKKKVTKELETAILTERERKDIESGLQQLEEFLKTIGETMGELQMTGETMGELQMTGEMEEQLRLIKRENAEVFVHNWKVNKALFAKYGGRVRFQQMGPEPLDAYRDFLKEQEKKGAFQILDEKYKNGFWRYFTVGATQVFYDKDDGAKHINTPWWMTDSAGSFYNFN